MFEKKYSEEKLTEIPDIRKRKIIKAMKENIDVKCHDKIETFQNDTLTEI